MLPIFPKTIDNSYRGQWLAIPFLTLAALMKMAMSFNTLFNTRFIIETADRIPFNHYSPDSIPLILFLFQAWAISHLLFALLASLAMIRYRSMIPLATLLMLFEQLGRMVLRRVTELPGVPHDWTSMGTLITWGLFLAMVIALILSLWRRSGAQS